MPALQFELARLCALFKDFNMMHIRQGLPDADEDRMETVIWRNGS
jgi:hypothetical protein